MYLAPPLRGSASIFVKSGGAQKTRVMAVADGKTFDRIDTIPASDRQTDRRTDRTGITISRSVC